MADRWSIGNFTKNYAWGALDDGLVRLHEAIRVGFDGAIADVSRDEFRSRIVGLHRPDFILVNFFLFNYQSGNQSLLLADELVFQAVSFPHSKAFDRLAIHALNNSRAGKWKGAQTGQDRPSMWAHDYIIKRVSGELRWDTTHVNADDIENFLIKSPQYIGDTTRKLATNLAYIYRVGGLRKYSSGRIERWWTSALFLTLDRAMNEPDSNDSGTRSINSLLQELEIAHFIELAGKQSLAKKMALRHLCELYFACGELTRFSPDNVRELERVMLGDVREYANSNEPIEVSYRNDISMVKVIPRVCAMLASSVGFERMSTEELESSSTIEFVKVRTKRALAELESKGIQPTMSAAEFMRLTRGE